MFSALQKCMLTALLPAAIALAAQPASAQCSHGRQNDSQNSLASQQQLGRFQGPALLNAQKTLLPLQLTGTTNLNLAQQGAQLNALRQQRVLQRQQQTAALVAAAQQQQQQNAALAAALAQQQQAYETVVSSLTPQQQAQLLAALQLQLQQNAATAQLAAK
jgi:hypothetical protein